MQELFAEARCKILSSWIFFHEIAGNYGANMMLGHQRFGKERVAKTAGWKFCKENSTKNVLPTCSVQDIELTGQRSGYERTHGARTFRYTPSHSVGSSKRGVAVLSSVY